MRLTKKTLKPNQVKLFYELEKRFRERDKRVKLVGCFEFEGER